MRRLERRKLLSATEEREASEKSTATLSRVAVAVHRFARYAAYIIVVVPGQLRAGGDVPTPRIEG